MRFPQYFLPLLVLFFIFPIKNFAQRLGHYNEDWIILKTEHFDVVVTAKQHDLGLYYADAAERAYEDLSEVFEIMTDRVVVIINDSTDLPNGYATRLPYPHIMIYPVPPDEMGPLSENGGDWARELITHELTHIAQLEPAHGIYSAFRPLLGSIVAPNLLMPSWWKEGMAVEMETAFSPRGRLRSLYQDATLRSLVLSKKLFTYSLAQANEVLPSWPYGNRPYLFGSMIFNTITAETKSLKTPGYLAQRQGERIPFFIEEPLFEAAGSNYELIYKKALYNSESIALAQIEKIKTVSATQTVLIFPEDQNSISPRYSGKYKLLAYIESKEAESGITVLENEVQKLNLKNAPSGTILNIDFHPSEKKIAFTKNESIDSKNKFSDIHIYDLEKDESTQVTFGQRTRSIRYSETGEFIVFISTVGGKSALQTIDLATKKISTLLTSDFNERFTFPIFWDVSHVLFVRVLPDGTNQLELINSNTLELQKISLPKTPDLKGIRNPIKKNGRLFFISSSNNVQNIYSAHLDSSYRLTSISPLTNLLTGAWTFDLDIDQGKIWLSEITENGMHISSTTLSRLPEELPRIENKVAESYSFKEKSRLKTNAEKSDYSAFPYVWPHYWIPFVATTSSSDGLYLQAETSGNDPIGLHRYALVGGYDTQLRRGNFAGIYTNSQFKIPFQMISLVDSFALGTTADIVQTNTNSIALLPDMFSLNKNLQLGVGLSTQDTFYTSYTRHYGAFIQLNYKNFSQNIFQISPESGWGGSLRFTKNFKAEESVSGTAIDYNKALVSLIGFFSPGIREHDAIKAKFSGLFTFESVLGRYGNSNDSAMHSSDEINAEFIMRGYSSAQFFGRNMWNLNLEYRFLVDTLERGSGTDPYFLKNITGAFIADGIGVDGASLTENLRFQTLSANESIWNTGVELRLNTTVGYVLPMNFILGYYLPHSPIYGSASKIGLGLQIGGF